MQMRFKYAVMANALWQMRYGECVMANALWQMRYGKCVAGLPLMQMRSRSAVFSPLFMFVVGRAGLEFSPCVGCTWVGGWSGLPC